MSETVNSLPVERIIDTIDSYMEGLKKKNAVFKSSKASTLLIVVLTVSIFVTCVGIFLTSAYPPLFKLVSPAISVTFLVLAVVYVVWQAYYLKDVIGRDRERGISSNVSKNHLIRVFDVFDPLSNELKKHSEEDRKKFICIMEHKIRYESNISNLLISITTFIAIFKLLFSNLLQAQNVVIETLNDIFIRPPLVSFTIYFSLLTALVVGLIMKSQLIPRWIRYVDYVKYSLS